LEEYHIGFLSNAASKTVSSQANGNSEVVYEKTGMANEDDLSVETDFASDYKKHKFLDLSKPLFPQLWFGGFSKEFYLDQVHRPRHYKGGESAPLFGNFLEPLSKTPWYVIPLLWIPCVAYGTMIGAVGLNNPTASVGCFVLGLFVWTLLEYGLHRFLFHIDK
jgi:4-hydroxysphinganine ceramide fatty acyl 2-hydroxylase